jgi:hypothetical protein
MNGKNGRNRKKGTNLFVLLAACSSSPKTHKSSRLSAHSRADKWGEKAGTLELFFIGFEAIKVKQVNN